MTPGPDYYRLADGRQFYEYSRDVLVPMCIRGKMTAWDIHCLVSAMEHRFRMGAKPGESDTDREASAWWVDRMVFDKVSPNTLYVIRMIDDERKKVGR